MVVSVEGVKAAVQAAVVTTDSLVHLVTHALSSSHCRTAGHHHGTILGLPLSPMNVDIQAA